MSTLTNNNPGKTHQHDESTTRKRLSGNRSIQRRRSSNVDVSSLTMRVRI